MARDTDTVLPLVATTMRTTLCCVLICLLCSLSEMAVFCGLIFGASLITVIVRAPQESDTEHAERGRKGRPEDE